MADMQPDAISAAAATLWRHWDASTRLDALPADCRPADRADGYAIQSALATLSGQPVVGWKIAATSLAGQAHIGVDGPLAGRLLANRVIDADAGRAHISLTGNLMRVAEAEFGFRLARSLPRRETAYTVAEVVDAVASLHPTIEVPDSRYGDFARVGAPQLVADDACACWLMVGPETRAAWRDRDLAQHAVEGYLNGVHTVSGRGANVLGDPRLALTWLANELVRFGDGLRAGDLVTTGTCIVPVHIAPGDVFRAEFGDLGTLEATLL